MKKWIPLSAIITLANKHDIDIIIDAIDNAVVIKRPSLLYFKKGKKSKHYLCHLCLNRACNLNQPTRDN